MSDSTGVVSEREGQSVLQLGLCLGNTALFPESALNWGCVPTAGWVSEWWLLNRAWSLLMGTELLSEMR